MGLVTVEDQLVFTLESTQGRILMNTDSGNARPGSSSSSQQLFRAGKGRPGSGSSLGSLGEAGGGAGPVSVSSSDSGVDISPSPGDQILTANQI